MHNVQIVTKCADCHNAQIVTMRRLSQNVQIVKWKFLQVVGARSWLKCSWMKFEETPGGKLRKLNFHESQTLHVRFWLNMELYRIQKLCK